MSYGSFGQQDIDNHSIDYAGYDDKTLKGVCLLWFYLVSNKMCNKRVLLFGTIIWKNLAFTRLWELFMLSWTENAYFENLLDFLNMIT